MKINGVTKCTTAADVGSASPTVNVAVNQFIKNNRGENPVLYMKYNQK